jgi:hypothetical protein
MNAPMEAEATSETCERSSALRARYHPNSASTRLSREDTIRSRWERSRRTVAGTGTACVEGETAMGIRA